MKFDQIAYYCPTPLLAERLKLELGLAEAAWVEDTVTATTTYWPKSARERTETTVAELQYNYDLGTELEILRFTGGSHWSSEIIKGRSFLSHIGVHLDDGEDWPKVSWPCIIDTHTLKHTNSYLTNPSEKGYGRLFHYRIYQTDPHNYIKFIRRIHPQ